MFWRIYFGFLFIYFPISILIIYYQYRKRKSQVSKDMRKIQEYLYGLMELEKLYLNELFEISKKQGLTKNKLKEHFRLRVKNENNSLKTPDFPKDDVLKEIRSKYGEI